MQVFLVKSCKDFLVIVHNMYYMLTDCMIARKKGDKTKAGTLSDSRSYLVL